MLTGILFADFLNTFENLNGLNTFTVFLILLTCKKGKRFPKVESENIYQLER